LKQAKPDLNASPLLTDLYQLAMLRGYFDRDMTQTAVFEFFVRRLPEQRNFLLAAGLEQALDYLESLHFSDRDLNALRETGLFEAPFLERLARLRFTGDVDALPEGTTFFADEPVLRVTAPLPEAQLVESRLINILHFQTLIASKAARCVLAAPNKQLVDFGMRRAHGSEAAVLAARASYIAGFAGTATVIAQPLFGVPIYGTMAHSFIQAHDSEREAFEHFARSHRGAIVLLIDTYDTETGARRVAELAKQLAEDGIHVHSVRLDSGDLGKLAHRVRDILDDAGASDIGIFASGGIEELKLQALAGDPIDGFGIGTALDVSADVPALDCVYKIQEYAGRARRKRSPGKETWPGRKQVFRHYAQDGLLDHDTLALVGEDAAGEALIRPVMRDGKRLEPPPAIGALRERAHRSLERLGPSLRSLSERAAYPVEVTPRLRALARQVDEQFR
jgi:nicotinate phosphoribosyltransferase